MKLTLIIVATLVVAATAQTPFTGRFSLGLLQALKGDMQPAGGACPPKGFNSVKNFNLTRYISAPWYVQKQVRTKRHTTHTTTLFKGVVANKKWSNPV